MSTRDDGSQFIRRLRKSNAPNEYLLNNSRMDIEDGGHTEGNLKLRVPGRKNLGKGLDFFSKILDTLRAACLLLTSAAGIVLIILLHTNYKNAGGADNTMIVNFKSFVATYAATCNDDPNAPTGCVVTVADDGNDVIEDVGVYLLWMAIALLVSYGAVPLAAWIFGYILKNIIGSDAKISPDGNSNEEGVQVETDYVKFSLSFGIFFTDHILHAIVWPLATAFILPYLGTNDYDLILAMVGVTTALALLLGHEEYALSKIVAKVKPEKLTAVLKDSKAEKLTRWNFKIAVSDSDDFTIDLDVLRAKFNVIDLITGWFIFFYLLVMFRKYNNTLLALGPKTPADTDRMPDWVNSYFIILMIWVSLNVFIQLVERLTNDVTRTLVGKEAKTSDIGLAIKEYFAVKGRFAMIRKIVNVLMIYLLVFFAADGNYQNTDTVIA